MGRIAVDGQLRYSQTYAAGLAAACVSKRRVSLLPLQVASTPGVIFLSSVVNPSGTEIGAAIALWAVLPGSLVAEQHSRLESATLAFADVALILARPLGMVQCLVISVALVATGTTFRVLQILRESKIITSLQLVAGLFASCPA